MPATNCSFLCEFSNSDHHNDLSTINSLWRLSHHLFQLWLQLQMYRTHKFLLPFFYTSSSSISPHLILAPVIFLFLPRFSSHHFSTSPHLSTSSLLFLTPLLLSFLPLHLISSLSCLAFLFLFLLLFLPSTSLWCLYNKQTIGWFYSTPKPHFPFISSQGINYSKG